MASLATVRTPGGAPMRSCKRAWAIEGHRQKQVPEPSGPAAEQRLADGAGDADTQQRGPGDHAGEEQPGQVGAPALVEAEGVAHRTGVRSKRAQAALVLGVVTTFCMVHGFAGPGSRFVRYYP